MTLLKELSVLLMIHVRRPDSLTGSASRWQIGILFPFDSKQLAASMRRTFLAAIWAVVHARPSNLGLSTCRLQCASDGAIHALFRSDIARDTVDLKWFRRLGRDPLERTISIMALSMGIVRSHMDANIDKLCVTKHGSHSGHAIQPVCVPY